MTAVRPEEAWARACIERALGGAVVTHHDVGGDAQFDLALWQDGELVGAVEVTQVMDRPVTELWNLLNSDGRWIEPAIRGGWIVHLDSKARANDLRQQLPTFLACLEDTDRREVWVRPSRSVDYFERTAARLGIIDAVQSPTAFPGSIYPLPQQAGEKTGATFGVSGDALAKWLGPWVRDPVRVDNPKKLAKSGCRERHLFVVFSPFADTPFTVSYLVMVPDAPLPMMSPDLPDEVTHVWAASNWDTGRGMRWSPDGGWQRFDTAP
jgi:hypothetical protein